MNITDPIADLLTRIRNASQAKHATVDIPASNMKKAIAQILVDEGYVKSYTVKEDDKQGVITITLKYTDNMQPVITGLRRISKPGLRIYTSCEDMPKVLKGIGTAIVSTPKGVMTDKQARKENVGGEVLAFVWEGGK
ncbi:MAG: 30S ribosomal protein S8 [Oscillospiraceae bacterium]|nr:30S ribosomal protein S8 [Oscillospiraceae bacterium]